MGRLQCSVIAAVSVLGFASFASAADMPVKARPFVAPVAAYNWTGCYIGVVGGGNWGSARNTSFDNTFGPTYVGDMTGSYNLSGGMVGGTTGCNYQTGQLVFGIEADGSWTNKRGSSYVHAPFAADTLLETKENWIATIRGRIGDAFADRWLVYLTGGAAAVEARLRGSNASFAFGSGAEASETQTRWGWTIGGGVEWAFARNWSAKVEYLHADFGESDYFTPNVTISKPDGLGGFYNFTFLSQKVRLTDDMVRVGVNYKFSNGL